MGPRRVSQFPGHLRLSGWDTPALFPGSNTHTHTHCPHGAHTHTSLHCFLVHTHTPTHTHIHSVLIAPSHCLRRLEWYWKEAILVCRSLNKPLQPATSHPPICNPSLVGIDERTADADLPASETEASLCVSTIDHLKTECSICISLLPAIIFSFGVQSAVAKL